MKKWMVRIVALQDVEVALNALERDVPSSAPPILTYVDQTRVIIVWTYQETQLDATAL